MSDWAVYILRCGDGTYYTGITTNTQKRLGVHNAGKGAKYTAARLPVQLVYSEPSANRSAATKRELAIKALKRSEKTDLIKTYAGRPHTNPAL